MSIRRLLRWSAVILAALLALLAATLAVILASGVTVSLDGYREHIESALSTRLSRSVRVQGPITLTPTLTLTLSVGGLSVGGPRGWPEAGLLRSGPATIELDILALLRDTLEIEELTIEDVRITLQESPQGIANWRFPPASGAKPGQGLELVALDRLVMQPVSVSYHQMDVDETHLLHFEGITGRIPAEGTLELAIQGEFRELPYVAQLTGGSLGGLLAGNEPWPLDLAFATTASQLRLHGAIAGTAPGASTTELSIELAAQRMGDLAAWFGLSPEAEAAFSARGNFHLDTDRLELALASAQLGRTRFSGKLGWNGIATSPVLFADLEFSLVDPGELQTLLEPGPQDAPANTLMELIDWPIFPEGLRFENADIDVAADRILLQPFDLTDVALEARFRDGRMQRSPFQMAIGRTLFKGELGLNLHGGVREAEGTLTADNADLGELLQGFAIADGIEASASRVELTLSGRGETPRKLMEQADFSLTLENGRWILDDPRLQGRTRIDIRRGSIKADSGRPIRVSLDGAVDQAPVQIEIQSGTLASLINRSDRLGLKINARSAGNRLDFEGAVVLPLEHNKLSLKLTLRGSRLDTLEPLLGIELPPLGPYHLQGTLNMAQSGYYVSDLDLLVGKSHLYGTGALHLTKGRPQLAINLAASTVQLDDFHHGLLSRKLQSKAPGNRNEGSSADLGTTWMELLSPDVLESIDADLALKATQVLSGRDHLGSGRIEATLFDGRLHVSPMKLRVPGGPFSARFSLEHTDKGVLSDLTLQAERFNYGILARRIDPKTEMGGRITLDLTLSSRDPDLESLLYNASGNVNFAIWPESFEAGLMDMWALNIFTALMNRTGEGRSSKINCIVGRFDSRAGVLSPKRFTIDTTRIRAEGQGRIDLGKNTIDMVIIPGLKQAKILSLDTPVLIQGKLSDFEINLTSADLMKTTARLIFEAYYLPLALLLKGSTEVIPADGHDLCDAPAEWTETPLR